MANDLNQCTFIGRLGRDPETRAMPSGDSVTNITIAVGKQWKDKQGNKQEQTAWVPVVFFGKLAEIVAQYAKKGGRVMVSGEFRTRKYQAQDGSDRYATEIVADKFQLLDGKDDSSAGSREGNAGGQQASRPAPQQQSRPAPQQAAPQDNFDDIPF